MAEHPTGATVPRRLPAGATTDGDGIILAAGPVTLDIYIDFLCPFCRQFEVTSGPTLDTILSSGAGSLVYHPLGFLDRLSTTQYSSRAASASGCAADGGRFKEYKDALFAGQPPEGGPGLTDEQLVELGAELGLDGGFAGCVSAGAHLDWVAYVTARATERSVAGTPTVIIEGVKVPAEPRTILAAVRAAGG